MVSQGIANPSRVLYPCARSSRVLSAIQHTCQARGNRTKVGSAHPRNTDKK